MFMQRAHVLEASHRIGEGLKQGATPSVLRDRRNYGDRVPGCKACQKAFHALSDREVNRAIEECKAQRAGRKPSNPGLADNLVKPSRKEDSKECFQDSPSHDRGCY